MSFDLASDGNIYGSLPSGSLLLANQFPALPEQRAVVGRDLVYETEAGLIHAYKLSHPRRSFAIGLRVLTASDLQEVLTWYTNATERHWFLYKTAQGQANAGTTTTLDDNDLTYNYANEYIDQVLFMIGNTGAGQIRRVTASASQSGGTRLTFTSVTTAPDATTLFLLGWPVRFVGGIQRTAYGANLFSADFTLEEVLLSETV